MRNGYVARSLYPNGGQGQRRMVYLHREVLGLQPGDRLQADHIDGDRLDCRRANLRVVSHAQNAQNRLSRPGASRYRGVSWHRPTRKWMAQVTVGGQRHYLGLFESETDAGEAASECRLVHMPFTNEDRAIR